MLPLARLHELIDSVSRKFDDELAFDQHGENFSIDLELAGRSEALALANVRRS